MPKFVEHDHWFLGILWYKLHMQDCLQSELIKGQDKFQAYLLENGFWNLTFLMKIFEKSDEKWEEKGAYIYLKEIASQNSCRKEAEK